jgi:hypothetical protein
MKILLSYDIRSKHEEVKIKLLELGYRATIKGQTDLSNLPETTLFKNEEDFTCDSAIDEIISVTNSMEVELLRAIVVEFQNWTAIIGEEI